MIVDPRALVCAIVHPDRAGAFAASWAMGGDGEINLIPAPMLTDRRQGCVLGHVAANFTAGTDPVTVLEDDAIFRPGWDAPVEVPDDWDILWLGVEHLDPPVDVAPGIQRTGRSFRSHAYIARHPDRLCNDLQYMLNLRPEAGADVAIQCVTRAKYNVSPHRVGQAGGMSVRTGVYTPTMFWDTPTPLGPTIADAAFAPARLSPALDLHR